jgi:hypothetical protein
MRSLTDDAGTPPANIASPLRWTVFAVICVSIFALALAVVLVWAVAKSLPRVRQACSSRLGAVRGDRRRDWSVRVSYGRVKLSDFHAIENDTDLDDRIEAEMTER